MISSGSLTSKNWWFVIALVFRFFITFEVCGRQEVKWQGDFISLFCTTCKRRKSFLFQSRELLLDLFKGAVLKWNSVHSLWKFVREWWDGCGVMQNDWLSQNAMLHRKPQSLRKKTHVWLLKTYLFFLGGSKILEIKGSVIEMSLLFWCCLTLQNLCIIKLFILWYPLHPIPLSSLTSLSWSIPIIHV